MLLLAETFSQNQHTGHEHVDNKKKQNKQHTQKTTHKNGTCNKT